MSTYIERFNLKEDPFGISPNPDYLLATEQHQRAIQILQQGFERGTPFMLLTGPSGSGKTTICRAILRRLRPETYRVALVLNPINEPKAFFKNLLVEFGLSGEGDEVDQLNRFNRFLQANHETGRKSIMIVDDAQCLGSDVLEDIRLLSNFEKSNQKFLQILLIGQPEIRARLRTKRLRALNERITVRYHLSELCYHDVQRYLNHRLHVAGSSGWPTVSPLAMRFLQFKTHGNPRRINILMGKAILMANQEDQNQIGFRHIRRAIKEEA